MREMTEQTDQEEFDEFDDVKSKTRVKKEMLALQNMGVSLLELTETQLESLELSETTYVAIQNCKRIKSNSALKRQKQFIGKLMRKEDTDAIAQRLDEIHNEQNRQIRQHHVVENWRDELIDGDQEKLSAFIDQYPHCDRQQLRQLLTKIKKEKSQDKPPASARKLFKLIRETLCAV